MVEVRYGRIENYDCVKVKDENLAGEISLRSPLAYDNLIAQIPVRCGQENFLFTYITSQGPIVLPSESYKAIYDEGTEEILRNFLKSPEAGKWAKAVEEELKEIMIEGLVDFVEEELEYLESGCGMKAEKVRGDIKRPI